MSKNPFINALSALAYIVFVASVMTFGLKPLSHKPDTVFAPILVLTMLTLSVAMMAFIFFYTPLQLFIEGKKKEALNLFTKTLMVFASFAVVVFLILYLI